MLGKKLLSSTAPVGRASLAGTGGKRVPKDRVPADMQPASGARDRARRLFEFLKRFEERRSPARRSVDDAAWKLVLSDLPKHPSVQLGSEIEGEDSPVLSIGQPTLTACPEPPEIVRDWLLPGWKEPDREVDTQRSRNRPTTGDAIVERFEDSQSRGAAFAEWQQVRAAWAVAERPARDAAGLFQDVLGLWARLQREGEALRVFLGDAFLIWQREGDTAGPVNHPLILLEVELRFDEKRHELSFLEGVRPPFFYSELLSAFAELDGQKRKLCRAIVERGSEEGGAHPLGASTSDRKFVPD